MLTKQQPIELIPVYKSGARKGQPTNDALREISHKLNSYKYDQFELGLLKKEIENNTPAHVFKKRAREAEMMR